jgi:hypothetical protein
LVKNHVKRMQAKLHSRRDAAKYARRHGLVPRGSTLDTMKQLCSLYEHSLAA